MNSVMEISDTITFIHNGERWSLTGAVSVDAYIYGIQYEFTPFYTDV